MNCSTHNPTVDSDDYRNWIKLNEVKMLVFGGGVGVSDGISCLKVRVKERESVWWQPDKWYLLVCHWLVFEHLIVFVRQLNYEGGWWMEVKVIVREQMGGLSPPVRCQKAVFVSSGQLSAVTDLVVGQLAVPSLSETAGPQGPTV